MTDAEYKAIKVAEAQAAVDAAERKVEKVQAHLDGARAGVKAARADLARVKVTDYRWEVSTEHVTVHAK